MRASRLFDYHPNCKTLDVKGLGLVQPLICLSTLQRLALHPINSRAIVGGIDRIGILIDRP
jgi:hypothetical protein